MKESRNKKRLARKKYNIKGTSSVPRAVVYKSNKHFEVQVIDDTLGNTIAYYNSKKDIKGKNKDVALKAGKEISKICLKKGIKKIVFDRNGFPYTGKIKILAETMRNEGLDF